MPTKVNPASVKCGDVILVLNESKHARASQVVQTLLRGWDVLSRRRGLASYSHVMLGISQGVVIHADGTEVKVEPLSTALEDELDRVEHARFRVVRPDAPGLSDADERKLAAEALRFLKERYSFVFGRRSGWLGRLLHRNKTLTQPFCSELIASAYKAIERPIGIRTPDRTLPSDLDSSCIAPAWSNVTDEYFQPVLDPVVNDVIRVGDRTITLAQFFAEGEKLLHTGWEHDSRQKNLEHDIVKSIIAPAVRIQQAKCIELGVAKIVALKPMLLFGTRIQLTAADVSSLEAFYEQIRRGTVPGETPFSDALRTARPDIDPDRSAYEGIPSVNELRDLELVGNSALFGAKTLRLVTTLRAIAVGLGIPLKEPLYAGITFSSVEKLATLVPSLDDASAVAIQRAITTLIMPAMKCAGEPLSSEADAKWTHDVRDMCNRVVQFHLMVSLLLIGPGDRPSLSLRASSS